MKTMSTYHSFSGCDGNFDLGIYLKLLSSKHFGFLSSIFVHCKNKIKRNNVFLLLLWRRRYAMYKPIASANKYGVSKCSGEGRLSSIEDFLQYEYYCIYLIYLYILLPWNRIGFPVKASCCWVFLERWGWSTFLNFWTNAFRQHQNQ
jgi:hypothetical protein